MSSSVFQKFKKHHVTILLPAPPEEEPRSAI